MKKIKIYLIFIVYIILSCNNKKSELNIEKTHSLENNNKMLISTNNKLKNENDFEKKWLLNFYTEYINFYLNSSNRLDKTKLPVFFKQLDSIKKTNCTNSFYLKQNEDDIVKDFDFITNNEFICNQSIESLEINKDSIKKDTYVVSFIAEFPLNEKESEFKKISFEVSIVNENGNYKISNTCCF